MPFLQTNGIRLYFEEHGSGPPLLLIMGITAAGSVWEKHLAYWQKSFRCIIADNRGVGLSDIPAGPYTTAQMADDYAGLLDHLGLQAVKVVGCSMGSTIAQQLALRHPSKVQAMVLMCPWARCDNKAKAIFKNMVDCKASLKPEDFALHMQLLIFSKSSWDDDERVTEMEEGRKQASLQPDNQPLQGLEGQAAACASHDVLNQLSQITQPVLVIGGSADIFTPGWMAKEVAANLSNATLHLYNGKGHVFHWEELNDFNERVEKWLLSH